jgi:hypothetical protein
MGFYGEHGEYHNLPITALSMSTMTSRQSDEKYSSPKEDKRVREGPKMEASAKLENCTLQVPFNPRS